MRHSSHRPQTDFLVTRTSLTLATAALFAVMSSATAQPKAATSFPPDPQTLAKIEAKRQELAKALAELKSKGVKDPALGDVEVYDRAARVMLRNNDFHAADSAKGTLEMLDQGIQRAAAVLAGTDTYQRPGTRSVRAYRSRVDGSLQPYIVSVPADFGKDEKIWRLDVVLHGRNDTMTEALWIRGAPDRAAGKDPWVQIDVFGRGNNAYRWVGEADVFVALEDFLAREKAAGRAQNLDRKKFVLRGFSMGGAGTWHLGLHHPDLWCAIGPGAGFSATAGLAAERSKAWDECLHIYDAVDYAGNAFMVPIVAYSGADDPQKKAADNIEGRLKKLDLSRHMTHLIAPATKHSFPADYFRKADALLAIHAAKGRDPYPADVRFTTWTLKYPRCEWLEILRLDRHYSEAKIRANYSDKGFDIDTANTRMLRLTMPKNVGAKVHIKIDDVALDAVPQTSGPNQVVTLEKKDKTWSALTKDPVAGLEKVHGSTGPIDDAFTDSFLCVEGSGKAWHPAVAAYAVGELKRFTYEWHKYLHGDLPLKKDVDVTDADIANKNLILFGDPASNSLIAKILPKLPLEWTKDAVALAGAKGDAADHIPVLIYPNPLNPKKYIVLNSGHTFKESEFKATNAFLFPRLGDYALLKLVPSATNPLQTDPKIIGLFDEKWQPR